MDEIKRWNALCDDVLFYGRLRLMELAATDRKFLMTYLPSWLRGLGPLSTLVAWLGLRRWALLRREVSINTAVDSFLEKCSESD